MGLSTLRRILCAALVLATGVVQAGCTQRSEPRFEATREPVIAVLCQMSREVVLLDPSDLGVVQRIPLRSQSLDMDVSGRVILTAQSGGHGADMGREFGRVTLETGRVEYSALESMDIQMVAAPVGGWHMLTTGLISSEGQWLHRVSPEGDVENLHLSPGVCGCVSTADNVWVWHYWDDETGHPTDRYLVYDQTGEPRAISSELTLTTTLCGFERQVVAFAADDDAATLVRHDPRSGAVLGSERITGFETGPCYAWAAGDCIAIADGPYGDYYEASRLVLVDAVSLKVEGAVESLHGVSAVNEGPDGTLIICEGDGTVSLLDSTTLKVRASEVVGDPQGDLVDVEFIP